MAKFPVEMGDNEGTIDAINYLLSGPAGLGQNFAGFSSYTPAYLTGNFRIPFSQPTPAELYVAPISISNAEQLDDRTIKFTFATPVSTPPFALGNGIASTGITPNDWDSTNLKNAGYSIYQIGVVECTTTYVIVRTVAPITTPLPAYVSGGSVEYSSTDTGNNSSDCDVRVTVTGGTDRVFISGQMDQIVSYEVSSGSPDLNVYVEITRFVGSINNDPVNPDYIFDPDTTVSQKIYSFTGLTGTGSLPLIETVFASVLDTPPPGYYRYIIEMYFQTLGTGTLQVTTDEMKLRSITAQVVKQ